MNEGFSKGFCTGKAIQRRGPGQSVNHRTPKLKSVAVQIQLL